ncbi:1-acyl-sn-glycerol-3-phosphate acyltransferase [Nocardioides carbamazepini]|uniref:lysophospholipid acyltransferase family protein n=1 Tax=Nocardioides carbamazepini TaxID=2854259 RepID=UPI00214A41F6|nr:1-acyl-sn-glycerol-3-phosphate acyltransferase [Nocardioides carbamazepini]MCR1783597.1 1-acyl-sn-glycerol-3-phosphate acyltransferase [Nocardioides carbamazepini]
MADAEIIPIGTRGQPGRGTGKRPSAAARGLAPKSATPRKAAPAKKPATPTPDGAPVEERPVVDDTPVIEIPSLLDTPADVPPTTSSTAPAARTEERGSSPLAGIPAGDWLSAFQHASKELFGDQWEPQLARFLAFLRRRLTGDYTVDEYGFDAEVTERFFMAALRPVAQKWFRIEVRGIDNIPAEGGALVVSNHSGTVPVDGLMTMVSIHDHTGRFLRPLGADLVFRLPLVGSVARKGGATLACSEDAERMLRGGELVGVWPEGFKGIGKPFSERYKLQRFGRGGFVAAALRTGVPIVPLSVVGAEEIYPLVGNIPSLARLLGVPYIPITPLFPLLGPLGLVPLPSKWLLEFGEPIRTDEYDAGAADDPMLVFNVTDQVRETIQQTLYSLLMQRESVFR